MVKCKNISNENFFIENKFMEWILEKNMYFIFMEIGVLAVSVFGLVGNVFSLFVLIKEKVNYCLIRMEKFVYIGLIVLVVFDFMFCLLVLLFIIFLL